MNCPKCGSKNIIIEKSLNGFSTCYDCGYRWQHGMKQPEPSTAEKLLWLAENFNVNIQDDCGIEVVIECRKNGRWADYLVGDEYESKTLAEAINAAYEWARKEEL